MSAGGPSLCVRPFRGEIEVCAICSDNVIRLEHI